MDILISVAAKVAEYLVAPVLNLACLFWYSGASIEELGKVYGELQSEHTKLKSDFQEAVSSNGEEITEEVNHWLQNTESTLESVGGWLRSVNDQSTIRRFYSHNWGWKYQQNKEAKRKTDEIKQLLIRRHNIPRLTVIAPPKGIQLIPRDDFSAFDSVKKAFKEIVKALETRGTNMVGVYGMGGIGKTTLVKEVGFHAKKEGLFNMVVLAVVSQSPNIHRIQTQLGEQLSLTYSRESEFGRADQLRTRMERERKILVILDDVWRKIDLREIGIPYDGNGHNGCKVLLTTRREQVCAFMKCQQTVQLSLLEEDEAWQLFKMNTGKTLDNPSTELEKVAKQVCQECGGLPLALIVVGRALRDKDLTEWELAVYKLQTSRLGDIEGVEPEENVYSSIKLSYDFLKGEATKKCFLLCCLYPEDHEINIDELALYAKGFVFSDEEDVGLFPLAMKQVEITVKDLIESSLLMTKNTMSHNVKMHDVVRDAALWITSKVEDAFLVPIPSQNNWIRSQRVTTATAISLLACPMNQQFPDHAACAKLKILLFAQRASLHLRNNCFQGMKALQVLDLTTRARYPPELDLPDSLEHLCNLRTLLLRRWKLHDDISIIGSLSNLEILSLSGCIIAELPMALVKLSELKLLDLSGCDRLSGSYTEVLAQLLKLGLVKFRSPSDEPIAAIVDDEE